MSIKDLSDAQLNKVLAEAKVTEAQAKKRKEEAQREFLRRHGKQVGTEIDTGGVSVELQINRRFNVELAQSTLTPEELEAISVRKPDSKLAAELLDPERYNACMKESTPKFSVGLGFN